MSDTNKIVLGGNLDAVTDDDGEVASGETINPGDFAEKNNENDPDEFAAQSTAAEEGIPLYITVKDYVGGGIDSSSTASYADSDGQYDAGEHINVALVGTGVRLNARCASGTNYTFGDKLVLNGDGTLRALDTAGGDDVSDTVAVARENNDLSGASSPDHVEVLTV